LTESDKKLYAEVLSNRKNIEQNLLPALRGTTPGSLKMNFYTGNHPAPPKEPPAAEQQFSKKVAQIEESASRIMRKGMSYELSPGANERDNGNVAYAAILNFGFGDLVLNLKEIEPGWIGKEIRHLRIWYFSIIAIVFLAVLLELVSLWRNAAAHNGFVEIVSAKPSGAIFRVALAAQT